MNGDGRAFGRTDRTTVAIPLAGRFDRRRSGDSEDTGTSAGAPPEVVMRQRALLSTLLLACACLSAPAAAIADPAPPQPATDSAAEPVERTTIAGRVDRGAGWELGQANAPRGALSLAKLYLADHALRHGDGSAADTALGERMIRWSDDAAADTLAARYPNAIAAIAAEYGLTATMPAGHWSASATSSADAADFLITLTRTHPFSPILTWMATAGDHAVDGTPQDWGTSRVPGVLGTKWGWSDFGAPDVASVSYGPGFTVAAHTYGSAEDQTADVLAALPQILGAIAGAPPDAVEQLDGIAGEFAGGR